ncbi:MAG TPA: hypothetical protein VHL81_08285 [Gemmatimonadales bacterium]|jgi:hypothetical protein|nr:hypothetical protein [Gemmatimonadales bacterium]
MRSYWMRILLGAVAIFAIGMIGVTFYRRSAEKVHEVVAGAGPLSIPLPFVPFELEGNRLGKVERLVVNRDAPKKVSSVDLEVKLDDSLVAQGLADCRLAANVESDSSSTGDLNVHVGRKGRGAFFSCVDDDSSLVEFGTAHLSPGDVTVPLLIPEALADQLRSGRWESGADSADALAEHAESLAGQAERSADSIGRREDVRAESLAAAGRRLGDSLRRVGQRRADSLLRELADSLPRR